MGTIRGKHNSPGIYIGIKNIKNPYITPKTKTVGGATTNKSTPYTPQPTPIIKLWGLGMDLPGTLRQAD